MKKKAMGIILVAGVLLATAGVVVTNKGKQLEVEIALVQRGNIKEYVEELGLVVPKHSVDIFVPAVGRVAEIMVEIGDLVNKGDILLKLDSEQLSRQMMELEAQKVALTAQYNEAIKPIDQKEIDKVTLQLNNQKNKVEEAKRQKQLNQTLYEAEAISYETYHASIKALEEEESLLESIRLDLEIIQKSVSQNVINNYKAQLKQLDIHMEELKSQGRDLVVVAPITGTVMTKSVEVGAYLSQGTQVMQIADNQAFYIESDILVSEIAKIKLGTEVEISHKDLGIEKVKGTIRKIYPQAFSKVSDLGIEQKRIKVEIDLKEAVQDLRAGYDLDLEIIIKQQDDTLLIPESAVFEKDGKVYVFVNENSIASLREIKKGIESKRQIEVIEGLQEGERVIVSPDNKLEEGTALISYSA